MDSRTPPRRWFRFSLRELLIATVAIAAVAALFVKNRPYQPTPFLQNFDARALLTTLGKENGLAVEPIAYAGGNSLGPGRQTLEQELVYHRVTAEELRGSVMPAFRARVEKLLGSSGCEIEGRGASGKLEDASQRWSKVREFSFDYRYGETRGVFRAYVFESPTGNTEVLVLIDEW